MREIAIVLATLLACLVPTASADVPEIAFDPEHPIKSAAVLACHALPRNGVPDGAFDDVPALHDGLGDQLDSTGDDLGEPRWWCISNAQTLGDVVELDIEML